jgi:hypothetical protein
MEAFGIVAFELAGADAADVEKVKTPEEDTLYCVTGFPLKLKENGIDSVEDHVGDELLPERIVAQPAGRPLPLGYSASVLSPPGFPGPAAGR